MLGETILSFLGRPIFRSKLAVSFSFRVYPKDPDTHGTHGSGIFVSPCLNSYTGESSQTRLWKSTKQRQREPPQTLCRQINVPPRSPVIPFTTCSIWRRLCHSMLRNTYNLLADHGQALARVSAEEPPAVADLPATSWRQRLFSPPASGTSMHSRWPTVLS